MAKSFEVSPYTTMDKRVMITGPEDIVLYVDYDDVNHFVIDEMIQLIVNELNWVFDRHDDVVSEAIERGYARAKEEEG